MAAEAAPTLPTLPEDLQQRILLQVDAVGLSRTACTCAHWRLVAQAAAEEQIAALLPPFPRGLPNVPWIKALASSEHLVALVGPPPAARTWRHEWKPLRMTQAELLAACDALYSPASSQQVRRMLEEALTAIFVHKN